MKNLLKQNFMTYSAVTSLVVGLGVGGQFLLSASPFDSEKPVLLDNIMLQKTSFHKSSAFQNASLEEKKWEEYMKAVVKQKILEGIKDTSVPASEHGKPLPGQPLTLFKTASSWAIGLCVESVSIDLAQIPEPGTPQETNAINDSVLCARDLLSLRP